MKCHACGSEACTVVLERVGIPRSGQFLRGEGEKFATADLRWVGCIACGLLWLDASPLDEVDYTHVVRGTKNQLPAYRDELVGLIAPAAAEGSVVEIGANDGTFLRLLQENGFRNLFGIEPSVAFRKAFESSGVPLINRHLTREALDEILSVTGTASAVVCRHTLEHVPQPLEFLRAMRSLLRDDRAIALVEVPDTRSLALQGSIHELWDEHLFYFSEPNLRLVMERSGLAVTEVRRCGHLGSENLIVVACRSSKADAVSSAARADIDVPLLRSRIGDLTDRAAKYGRNWHRPVAALGASHPQSNYLSLAGVAPFVDFLVDDDPTKVGRFVPLRGAEPVPVVSTETLLAESRAETFLMTAFGYSRWMDRVRERYRRDAALIDPYTFADVRSV